MSYRRYSACRFNNEREDTTITKKESARVSERWKKILLLPVGL